MSSFVGSAGISLPDRVVLKFPALAKDRVGAIVNKIVTDTGGPLASGIMLRPGNILLKGADETYYGDTTNGVQSAAAAAVSAMVPDATWATKTVVCSVDGVQIVSVALGGGVAALADVIAALQANAIFNAWFTAANDGTGKLKISTLEVGAGATLLVTSSLATAFGASGTSGVGSDGDWIVTDQYCFLQDPMSSSAPGRVSGARAGIFKQANLVWGGVNVLPADFTRVMAARGSRFE